MLAIGPGMEGVVHNAAPVLMVWPYYCLPQICDRPYTYVHPTYLVCFQSHPNSAPPIKSIQYWEEI